jgi:hypothetical protein
VRGMISADAWVGATIAPARVPGCGLTECSSGAVAPPHRLRSGQVLYPGNGNCFAFSTTKRAWSSAQLPAAPRGGLGPGGDQGCSRAGLVRDRIVDTLARWERQRLQQ